MAAALAFSSAKVRLGTQLRVHSPETLTATRLIAQCAFALIGFLVIDEASSIESPDFHPLIGFSAWAHEISAQQGSLIFVSALASGTLAAWLQASGQKSVPAPEAQLIYSLTPIFSAMWAFLFLHEPITIHEIIGGLALVTGTYLTLEKKEDCPSQVFDTEE